MCGGGSVETKEPCMSTIQGSILKSVSSCKELYFHKVVLTGSVLFSAGKIDHVIDE